MTSTDTGSLYSKSLNVTLRHYGCQIVRTEYYKELAARMVLASVARYDQSSWFSYSDADSNSVTLTCLHLAGQLHAATKELRCC